MVAMLSVGKQQIVMATCDKGYALREQSDFNINPVGNGTSYLREMRSIKLKGIRIAAQQIVKERRCSK